MLKYISISAVVVLAENLEKESLPTQWKCTDRSVTDKNFGAPVRLNRYGHIECFYNAETNGCQTSNDTQSCNDMMHRMNKVRTTRVLDCDSLEPKFLQINNQVYRRLEERFWNEANYDSANHWCGELLNSHFQLSKNTIKSYGCYSLCGQKFDECKVSCDRVSGNRRAMMRSIFKEDEPKDQCETDCEVESAFCDNDCLDIANSDF